MSPTPMRRDLVRPDATIRYWVSGPAKAPQVVLLHGATLDHRAWHAQVVALRARFGVVVPDLRGHGGSTLPDHFRFDDAVADTLALLDVVEAASPGAPLVLGGLSLGGNIAQEVVYRTPHRVDALVVADSSCNTADRHPLAVPMTAALIGALGLTSHEHFVRWAAEATSPNADVREYVTETNADRTNSETVRILTELLHNALHAEPEYRLPVPTLLLHGALDRIGDIAEGTQAWAERDALASHVVVPDAGHASNQDNPDAFNDALLAFLDALPAIGAARAAA